MQEKEIKQIIEKQNQFFSTGATLPVAKRIAALKQLKATIIKYEEKINAAIKEDLGKSAFESYMCEVGLVLSELSCQRKNSDNPTGSIRLPKLREAFPLWYCSHYESLELSFPANH